MLTIVPEVVVDATLTSSNIVESETQWSSATTYALGAQVRGPAGAYQHVLYQSVQASNTNHNPTTDTAGTWWIAIGVTNRWSMFDALVQSQSTRADNITVVLDPVGRIDSLCFFGVSCATIQVTMTDAVEGVVFNQTFSMVSSSFVDTWYEYFTTPIERVDKLYVDLPGGYYSPTITVSMTDTGSTVKCGALVQGLARDIGDTQYGATVGIQDFSRKERDDFGNYSIVERAYADTGNFTLLLDTAAVDGVKAWLTSLRAIPVVYIGSDAYTSTMIYGFFNEFAIEFTVYEKSTCTMRAEGLT